MMEQYIGAFVAEALRHGWDIEVSLSRELYLRCRKGNDRWMQVKTAAELNLLKFPAEAGREDVRNFFIKEKRC